jgi:hypothetical protein
VPCQHTLSGCRDTTRDFVPVKCRDTQYSRFPRNERHYPYSQGASDVIFPVVSDVIFPMTGITVFGKEGVVAYRLLADITQRWQTCRTTAGISDKCYRMAWERQTEVG